VARRTWSHFNSLCDPCSSYHLWQGPRDTHFLLSDPLSRFSTFTDDHKPLPGITVGDIGPKFGYHTQDNGFLRFDHFRVPRENMLARYSQVLPDGTYVAPRREFSKLSYGTMVYVRAIIVVRASVALAKACTIAIRYSAVRRQFSEEDGAQETQVLDYQMQQYRLFPLLATAYAFRFAGNYMMNLYNKLRQGIESSADVSILPEVHATSAGLKALTTWIASDGIEIARKCCGGHGFSQASGLVDLFVNFVPACTYEGDNVVLCQQTARYLFKSLKAALRGEKLVGSVTYLEKSVPPAHAPAGALDMDFLLQAYRSRARYLVVRTAQIHEGMKNQQVKEKDAWNAIQVDIVKMVQAHGLYSITERFYDAVRAVNNPSLRSELLVQNIQNSL